MSSNQEGRQSDGMGARAMMQAFNIGQESSVPAVQAPTMRSLQIGNAGPTLLGGPPPSFGKPPPLGISRPGRMGRSSSRGGSVGVKQEWDNLAVPTTWKISPDDLEMVPDDFPLERTHRRIEGVSAPVVATRISEALRHHSIEAVFNSKPPKAKCKTRDFVSFRIRLYAGGEDASEPVIVEVQRRSGSASCFMAACRAILNAAEGKSEAEVSQRLPPFAKKPIGQMKCLQGVKESKSDEKELADSALQDTLTMLRSKQRDSNLLGLENLCALTDPIKTNPAVSLLVSKSVALGLGAEDIREEIVAMADRDMFSSAPADDLTLSSHADLQRQLAWTILANSLSLCSKDGCLESAVAGQSWFRETLMPNLLDEVKRSQSNACNATQAATCIHSLASCSVQAREFLLDQGAVVVLKKANEYGIECNELLSNETDRCLKVLC